MYLNKGFPTKVCRTSAPLQVHLAYNKYVNSKCLSYQKIGQLPRIHHFQHETLGAASRTESRGAFTLTTVLDRLHCNLAKFLLCQQKIAQRIEICPKGESPLIDGSACPSEFCQSCESHEAKIRAFEAARPIHSCSFRRVSRRMKSIFRGRKHSTVTNPHYGIPI